MKVEEKRDLEKMKMKEGEVNEIESTEREMKKIIE